MIGFLKDLKRYASYAFFAAKSELKNEVANSYLNWLWWILDPLAFMLIYTFIVGVVFRAKEPNFPVFVFIGLTTWTFFNWMISGSVKLINNHRHIVSNIYVPKDILLFKASLVYLFKTLISYSLIILLFIFFKIPFTWNMLWFFPLLLVLYLICFGFGLFLMHFGVYVEDLFNLTNIVLKMMFYLSGIFYNIMTRVPAPYNQILAKLNPAAFIIGQLRKTLLYNQLPNIRALGLWFIIAIEIIILGTNLVRKYENSYAKVT